MNRIRRHSCGGKKRIVPKERCKACIDGIPLTREVAAKPKETIHFCRFSTAMCGVLNPRGRTQQDRQVTCEGCLLKRLSLLGVDVAGRALTRLSREPSERVAYLHNALANVRRLQTWLNKKPRKKLYDRRSA